MTRKKGAKTPRATSGFAESLERLKPLVPIDQLPLLLDELKKPLRSAIRVNLLKSSMEDVQDWADRYSWHLSQLPFCPTGYRVDSASLSISQTLEHKMGNYYIQDAASMLPVEFFDFSEVFSPLILDLAASPGGKTTQLISNTMDRGLIIANDSNQSRIPALRSILQNWSAANIAITRFAGEQFGNWFQNTFDAVLLDAPCSMEGLRATDAHPLRSISDRERTGLARRQISLLESALRATRIGGQVVYSTCTLAPEEDESVLDALLSKYPGSFRIEKIPSRLLVDAPALSQYHSQTYDRQMPNAARLWPHIFGTAGFFAARLVKLADIQGDKSPPPQFDIEKAGYYRLKKKEVEPILDILKGQYGFDLQSWLDEQQLEIWQKSSKVYAFPEMYLQRFNDFPFQGLGMSMAESTPEGWQLSHEFCSRFGRYFTAGIFSLPPDRYGSWLRGEDQQGLPLPEVDNPLVVVVDEWSRNLGRGKILSDRLKNLLPRRLV